MNREKGKNPFRIFLLDNFDSFTFNLVDYFEQLGCEVHVYRNDSDPKIVDEIKPDLIVLSPGPSIPKNAGNMLKIIDLYHKKYPIFGVCLGHEALIEYFGGTLKFVTPVHGKSSPISHNGKGIFEGLEPEFLAGRYHSLCGDKIPDCFEITATYGDLVMAVKHKNLPIESVQFHPESVLTMKGGNGFKFIENVVKVIQSPDVTPSLSSRAAASAEAPTESLQLQIPPAIPATSATSEQPSPNSPSRNKIVSFLENSINGKLSVDEQINFLKDYTPEKITAKDLKIFADFMLEKMASKLNMPHAIDICGTGGSGLPRINTSTIAAFILSQLSVGIAKHGNKAASGRFGSFDLLEGLDVNIEKTPSELENLYRKHNVAFIYARSFHPVMKHFAEARLKFGKPTVFNILGPLLNPANIKKQIIGTAFKNQMRLIAETCKLLGRERVMVVSGADGLDEVTLADRTKVVELNKGKIHEYFLSPKDFGMKPAKFKEIAGGSPEKNIRVAKAILSGKCHSQHADLVYINVALALLLADKVSSLKEGYGLAKNTIGLKKLEAYRGNILHEIAAGKLLRKSERSFYKALAGKKHAIIAEIKRASPSEGQIFKGDFDAAKIAQLYEQNGASAISVLADEKYFSGSFDYLRQAKDATKKLPILCKDFVVEEAQIYKAREYGADAILLIVSLLDKVKIKNFLKISGRLDMDALVEVHDEKELKTALSCGAKIIGINNRNLKNFSIDIGTTNRLIKKCPKNVVIVSESGINSRSDIEKLDKRVNAVLIGTSLMKAPDIKLKLHEITQKISLK